MRHAIGLPESRRTRVLICVLVGVALVLSVVLLIRWQRSEGHRADQYADSFREMPGVASVSLAGDGGPRDLTVHLSTSASRLQLQDIHDRRGDLPSDVIDDVTITLGRVSAETDDDEEADVDLQWALRGLRHGPVELRGYSSRVSVDNEQAPASVTAREIVATLDLRGFRKIDLEVSGADGTRVTVSDRLDLAAAHAVLDDVAPFSSYLSEISVHGSGVNLRLGAGHSDRMAKVSSAAQRASRHIRAFEIGDNFYFTVTDEGDGPSVHGDPDTGLAAWAKVTKTLEKEGWTVESIDTDLSEVSIGKQSSAAADLPRLRRDLAALKPTLPKDASVTLRHGKDRRLDVFSGTRSDLDRVAPGLVALEKDGYQLSWDSSPRDGTSISVLLPKGVPVGADSIRDVAPRLRDLGWDGKARIIIQQREKPGDRYVPAFITFSSTATGHASEVTSKPKHVAVLSAHDASRAWDSTAKK